MKNLKNNRVMQLIERPVSSKLVKKILIKNLIINTIFGYYPKEKVQKQKLKFNIKLEIDHKIKFNEIYHINCINFAVLEIRVFLWLVYGI